MCRRVQCSKCGQPTFAGCGAHVEQVLAGVPADKRCRCGAAKQRGAPASSGEPRSWFKGLFGR